ncbi:DUF2953 domain-containing protein [Clostridium lundense]|uniref:DUF2953 domain-containing protein n=1 Tax=Clostridium lundense TaxID=319475 RepID=UPI00068618D6|nr:DUF2953 domain-containing protein [Clostridium lundense]
MSIWIIILLFLLLISIIPFPIKIYFMYDLDKLVVKILWKTFKFNPKDLTKKQRIIIDKGEEFTKKSLKNRKFTFKQLKYMWINLKNSILKPSIKINIQLTYGVDDAAVTGILYGLINHLYSYIQYSIYSCFKVKEMNLNLQPEFNKKIIYIEMTSIIYINLVKTIYMFIIMFKSIHKAKKDSKNCVSKVTSVS